MLHETDANVYEDYGSNMTLNHIAAHYDMNSTESIIEEFKNMNDEERKPLIKLMLGFILDNLINYHYKYKARRM